MGKVVDIANTEQVFSDGLDPVVIRRYVSGITGGRTLDTAGFTGDVVRAGHIVIYETATDTYKPLGVSNGAYTALPSGCKYVGVVATSKPAKKPFVAIVNVGEVNDLALPYPLTDALRTALKSEIPTLIFTHD